MTPYCYECGGTECDHDKKKKKKKTFEDIEGNRMGYKDFTGGVD